MSKEWGILPFDHRPGGAFSAQGESGSVVVDGAGRIGGILTSGAGAHRLRPEDHPRQQVPRQRLPQAGPTYLGAARNSLLPNSHFTVIITRVTGILHSMIRQLRLQYRLNHEFELNVNLKDVQL